MRRSVRRENTEGLRLLWNQQTLRRIALCNLVLNFTGTMLTALYVLFLVRELELEPRSIGLVFGVGGLGFRAGALGAPRLSERRWPMAFRPSRYGS